jgi:hypothetical protein
LFWRYEEDTEFAPACKPLQLLNDTWESLTGGWLSLRTIVFFRTTLRLIRNPLGPVRPLFPSYSRFTPAFSQYPLVFSNQLLSPERQSLQVVFDFDRPSRALNPHDIPSESLLNVIDRSTSFLTLPSFGKDSIVVLVTSQVDKIDVMNKVAELGTEEQRARVMVAIREEWYVGEGIEAPLKDGEVSSRRMAPSWNGAR